MKTDFKLATSVAAAFCAGLSLSAVVGWRIGKRKHRTACNSCRVQEMWSYIMYDSGYMAGREGRPYAGKTESMMARYGQ